MTSFNANDGIPPSASKFLLTDVLRNEWQFDGVAVSDWASIGIMVTQGFCKDKKEAAMKTVRTTNTEVSPLGYRYELCG